MTESLLYLTMGLIAGVIAALFGVGGGILMVPMLLAMGANGIQSVGTSTLAIVLIALPSTFRNIIAKNITLRSVGVIGFSALLLAPVGANIAQQIDEKILLRSFAGFIFLNIALMRLNSRRTQLSAVEKDAVQNESAFKRLSYMLFIGAAGGMLAGLFGVGGGAILVPLQILLLKEDIKKAVQISLGVVAISTISALTVHLSKGNVLWQSGILLGIGGVAGSIVGQRLIHKLNANQLSILFQLFLAGIGVYMLLR